MLRNIQITDVSFRTPKNTNTYVGRKVLICTHNIYLLTIDEARNHITKLNEISNWS